MLSIISLKHVGGEPQALSGVEHTVQDLVMTFVKREIMVHWNSRDRLQPPAIIIGGNL